MSMSDILPIEIIVYILNMLKRNIRIDKTKKIVYVKYF